MQDEECVTAQFDYNRGYNGQCKCNTKGAMYEGGGIRYYNTRVLNPAPDRTPAGVEKFHTDRYWGYLKQGIVNQHGFGRKSAQECANDAKNDPDCVTGQFDFNTRTEVNVNV